MAMDPKDRRKKALANLPKNEDGTVKAGPGRPKGSVTGRTKLIESVDKMLKDPEVIRHLVSAMKKEAMENPIRFMRVFGLPLMPKKSMVEIDHKIETVTRTVLDAINQDLDFDEAEFEVIDEDECQED